MSFCPDHFYQPSHIGEHSCFKLLALKAHWSTTMSEQPLPFLLADENGYSDKDAINFTVLVQREWMPLGMATHLQLIETK